MLLRARGRHVEDAALLLLRRHAALGLDALEPRAVHRAAAQAGEPQAHAAVLGDPQRAVVVAAVLSEVREADNRELEALRAVHGHHPHRVEVLGLERCLALPGLEGVALRERIDETAEVAALVGLVLPGHPHQLSDVRHPARAAREREQVPVVPGERDRTVDQRLERHLADDPALGLEAVREGHEPAPVAGGELLEQLRFGFVAVAPKCGAQRPPRVAAGAPGVKTDQRHAVQGQPGERRGQDGVDGQPVERVGERGEPVAQVQDLLLAPVAATADHVHGYPALLERTLEQAHRRGGAEQHHHVAV